MPNNSEEENELQTIIEIYQVWDKIYPDRYAPGEIPTETSFYPYDLSIAKRETPIQKRIRRNITHGRKFLDDIDYRWNPELAPKKYYSDGILIDWHNLLESNQAYRNRCENHEFKLPGIETAIILYRERN